MMRGGGPPFVDKRCGLPLALPLLAKKLCPGLSFMLQTRAIFWGMESGKNTAYPAGPPARRAQAYALRCRAIPADRKKQKSGHGRDGHVRFFLMAASRQRKDNRSPAGLPRLQNDDALPGAQGRSPFPGRLKRHAAAPAGAHPCMSRFRKRWTGRAIGSHRIPASGLTHHDEEEEGSVARRRLRVSATGAMAPCLTVLF